MLGLNSHEICFLANSLNPASTGIDYQGPLPKYCSKFVSYTIRCLDLRNHRSVKRQRPPTTSISIFEIRNYAPSSPGLICPEKPKADLCEKGTLETPRRLAESHYFYAAASQSRELTPRTVD
jgi:hypothetical protein